jgi:aldehyde dehydrogenase (NAD+)
MVTIDQLQVMRNYYNSGATAAYAFRIDRLKALKKALLQYEEELYAALYTDLKKSKEESWVTELGMVLAELKVMVNHLSKWMKPEKVSTNLLNLPSSSFLYREPLGVVFIIGPWNYPLQLLFNPLLGAIAAGNCVVLKPSEFSPATNAVMKKIIEQVFTPQHVLLAEGEGAVVVPYLMKQFTFDHVFYTGSTAVGKIIYQLAAERLVPVTLELGGKSPAVVEADAALNVAARRIAVTKFSNAGQMCVAPDYVLVHESVKDAFIKAMQQTLVDFFGEKPEESYSYGKIINIKQFDRLTAYLKEGTIVLGGNTIKEQLYIEPTLLTNIPDDAAVMKDEIFGPILPILSFSNEEEAKAIINQHPNPLAFYVYTSSRQKEEYWLKTVSFGGGCVNNCSWHLTNHHLPFGGRGFSGTGRYHGRYSFETFSHLKAIMKTPTWFDPSIKYPPFNGRLKLFKRLIR